MDTRALTFGMEWRGTILRIIYHLPSVGSDLRHTWNTLTILNHAMDVHTLTFAMEWKRKIIIRTEHTTILTDIITTARVHLKTARAGDAVKHSNQDYHKIASNICMQKNTKYNCMQQGKIL